MHNDDVEVEPITGEESLWRLVTALAAARTPFEVAEVFTKLGAPAAGGSFTNVAMLTKEPDSVLVVHRPSLTPTVVTQRGIYDLAADTPACEAIRSGLPVLLGSLDEIQKRYPALLAEIEESGLSSRASLPLHSATGTTLGAIGFGWPGPQEFPAVQLRRLDLIAQLVGLALERAIDQQAESVHGDKLPSILETMSTLR